MIYYSSKKVNNIKYLDIHMHDMQYMLFSFYNYSKGNMRYTNKRAEFDLFA